MGEGEFATAAQAVARHGVRAEAETLTTRVQGNVSLVLEVVEADDPIEIRTETFYEIVVTNQGTGTATNVLVAAEVPDSVTITNAGGPTQGRAEGRIIRFAPIASLAPKAEAVYRVTFRGSRIGDVRIRVEATADQLNQPAVELESTKIYQD